MHWRCSWQCFLWLLHSEPTAPSVFSVGRVQTLFLQRRSGVQPSEESHNQPRQPKVQGAEAWMNGFVAMWVRLERALGGGR